jgi:hypothetical protein
MAKNARGPICENVGLDSAEIPEIKRLMELINKQKAWIIEKNAGIPTSAHLW